MSFRPALTIGVLCVFATSAAFSGEPPDDTRRLAEIHRTHFLWIVPNQNGAQAELIYSDSLKKSTDVFALHELDEIVGPIRIYAHDYENETAPLKLVGTKDGYWLSIPGKELTSITGKTFPMVTGLCRWRVFDDSKDGPYLLSYAASYAYRQRTSTRPWDRLALEILPNLGNAGTIVQATWMGKPLANADVEIFSPGQEKPVKESTGKHGSFIFEYAIRGNLKADFYGIRVRHVEDKEGKYHDRPYKQIHHFATLVLSRAKE